MTWINYFYGYSMEELFVKRLGLKHGAEIRREMRKDTIFL